MCSKLLLVVFALLIFLIKFSYEQRIQHYFRKDYKYLEGTESFYKTSTARKTWFEAKKICAKEGAKLFIPEDQKEVDVVLTYVNETHKFYSVFIGVSDLVVDSVFETIDGRSILDVYYNWAPGEPKNVDDEEHCVQLFYNGRLGEKRCTSALPFICKKTLASLDWNQFCNMPFLEYVYNENLDKCYKFHSNFVNWTDAHSICAAELSYLAVINSQEEANYFVQLSEKLIGNDLLGTVLLGVHNRIDEGWATVRGTTIEESGYNTWALGQPADDDRDKCGSMLYNGVLSPIGCEKKSIFICEHDIKHIAN